MDKLELSKEQYEFLSRVAREHMAFCVSMRDIGPVEKKQWWDGAAASCNDLLCRLGVGECVEDLAGSAWPDADIDNLPCMGRDYDD